MYKTLDRNNFWISNCDSKSSILLAFLGIFIPLILANTVTIESFKSGIKKLYNLTFPIAVELFIITLLFVLMCVFLGLALLNLFNSLKGTIDSSVFSNAGLELKSNLFFNTISSVSYEDYQRRANQPNRNKLLNDIQSQIYITAAICSKKFEHYNKGITNVKYALFFFTLLLIALIVLQLI